MIRILVVDDHPTIRHNLADMLHNTPGMTCIAHASNGPNALELTARHTPDIVIMDISMPHHDGIAATAHIHNRHPNTKIIALADWQNTQLQRQAHNAGATTHLLQGTDPDLLLQAIRNAAAD
jgi:DNA-binding NarL/FixJ family response regulator